MKVAAARRLVAAALVLLVLARVADGLFDAFGLIPAVVGSAVVLAVQLGCARLAGAHVRYHLYLWIPTLVFTVLPVAWKASRFFRGAERSTLARAWDFAPMLGGFVLPVVLLLAAWMCLRPADDRPHGRG